MFETTLLHLGAIIIVNLGGGIVVRTIIQRFPTTDLPHGFDQAGAIIGYLERSLIYLFLILGMPSMIGFLLTMKAVYRFGDIQGDNHTKMKISEYFIIGTMLSLLWTLIVYIGFNLLVPQLIVSKV